MNPFALEPNAKLMFLADPESGKDVK